MSKIQEAMSAQLRFERAREIYDTECKLFIDNYRKK